MPANRFGQPAVITGTATASRRARRVLVAAAATGTFLATWVLLLQSAIAQTPSADPSAAFGAARTHLAAEIGASADAITLARAEAVTWNDGCLGLATAGEFCTQALVDGWALWLRGPDAVYRVHTDAAGAVVRSAGAVDDTSSITALPLPDGASLRTVVPAPAPSGGAGLVPAGVTSAPAIGLLLALAGGAVVLGRWAAGRGAGA